MLVNERLRLAESLKSRKKAILKDAMKLRQFNYRPHSRPLEWLQKMADSTKVVDKKYDENLAIVCEGYYKFASSFDYAARASVCWKSLRDNIHAPTWIVSFTISALNSLNTIQGFDANKFDSATKIIYKNYITDPSLVGVRFGDTVAYSPFQAVCSFCRHFEHLILHQLQKHGIELKDVECFQVYPVVDEELVKFAREVMRVSNYSVPKETGINRIKQDIDLLLYKMYSQLCNVYLFYSKKHPNHLLHMDYSSELTDTESIIIEALGPNVLRGPELLKEAGYDNSSHYRSILSNLVKRNVIGRNSGGYYAL
jgi:hypothetical protein